MYGYGEMGVAGLETLLALPGAQVAGLVTHLDDPAEPIWFRSARDVAVRRGIPVLAPVDANAADTVAWTRDLRPDLLFSLYFRQVLRRATLALPRIAALNLHGSLLPRYRGRAPTNWAVLHGETRTGVTLHHMTERPDAGDIVAQGEVPIGEEDTAHDVFLRQVDAARALLPGAWPGLVNGTAPRIPQDNAQATVFGRRRPEDGRIDWTRSAREIGNLVRAVARPYPGAFTRLRGKRWTVWSARALGAPSHPGTPGRVVGSAQEGPLLSTGDGGTLLVRRCQWEGEEERSGADFVRAARLRPGEDAGEVEP